MGLHDSTRISVAYTSLGIRFPYQFSDQLRACIGVGPNFSNVWLKNRSQCSRRYILKQAVEGILKTRAYYFFHTDFFVDVFVDYLYQPMNFQTKVDVGGVKIGAGLGIRF